MDRNQHNDIFKGNTQHAPGLWSLLFKIIREYNAYSGDDEKKRENDIAERAAFWTKVIGLGTWAAALFALGTAVVLILQLSTTQKQLSEARDQLTYEHPPKIHVTNVSIGGSDGPPLLSPKVEVPGRAWIVNDGSEVATIKAISCVIYWRIGPLPMLRPYDVNDKRAQSCGALRKPDGTEVKPQTILTPGEIAKWKFSTMVPNEYKAGMFLYVMGNIMFVDRLNVRHLTLFARKYDADQGRFIEIKDNHDYEGEE